MGYKLVESIKEENRKVYFVKRRLQEIVGEYDLDGCEDYEEGTPAEIISDEITDTSRWSVYHECIFKIGERYFRTDYSRGATEMQDEAPYEYDGDYIEVTEVVPKEVTVIQYVNKGAV